jgi:2-phosphosulfolactate phosphatase
VVLGGERGGLKIPGFDLGNSPSEYTPERVGGKSVIFTTTNGTQALLRCRQAGRVVTAGFVNSSAVVAAIRDCERIDLVCAGTRGLISREDVLLAGCLLERLLDARTAPTSYPEVNDSGRLALDAWQAVCRPTIRREVAEVWEGTLREALAASQGGRDLFPLDLGDDVLDAAKIDHWSCVPELDVARWTIRDAAK